MRSEIESFLRFRKTVGDRYYYDCPFCKMKDPTESLVVTWDKEQFVCNHMDSCGEQGHIWKLAEHFNVNRNNHNKPMYHKPRPVEKKVYKPVRIEEPSNIDLTVKELSVDIKQRLRQLDALFNFEDKLIVCKNANYGETIESSIIVLENEFDNFTHFKVNHGGAKAEEIKEFSYTLIECDDMDDLNKQRDMMLGLGLPIATLVWSGNKSLHAVVKISALSREEYDRRVKLLHEVCHTAGFNIDKTKDPCRYTRLAGAINPKTNQVQKLIDINIGSASWDEWEVHFLPKLEVTKHTVNTSEFNSCAVIPGFSSGFLTHDYNDSGLKAGGLTIMTGRRNQGKTTFSRQIMIATARQELGVFAYMGEGEKEREKGYLERLIAKDGELIPYDNGFGRTDWFVNEVAQKRYNQEIAPFIDFYNKPLRLSGKVFSSLMSEMTIKARQGTVLFVIDNMMKLTADQGETFKAQQRIVAKLKEFAVHFKVHVILIAHPRKDGTSVSGAMEIENTADTILKFTRIFSPLETELPAHENEKVTAIVTNEKVRDGGKAYSMYMEFDGIRQANIEIVYIPEIYQLASQYRHDGYFSRELLCM